MDDSNTFAVMEMAHEDCHFDEHCNKWHCPYAEKVEHDSHCTCEPCTDYYIENSQE